MSNWKTSHFPADTLALILKKVGTSMGRPIYCDEADVEAVTAGLRMSREVARGVHPCCPECHDYLPDKGRFCPRCGRKRSGRRS